jgi:hypothetical protein
MECPFDSIKTHYECWSDFENKNLETHTQIISKINSRNEKLDELQLFINKNSIQLNYDDDFKYLIQNNPIKKYYTNELNKKMYQYYISNF